MEAEANQLDMLHGPIWNKITRFALPIAATAILGQLFNAADIAVAGNLRTASVAAVSATSAIAGLVVNLFVGISLGADVTIAYAVGQKTSRP